MAEDITGIVQDVRVNIGVKKDQSFNAATGVYEDTGDMRNTVRAFLPA